MNLPLHRWRATLALALCTTGFAAGPAQAQFGPPSFGAISSASGDWTDPNIWVTGSGPGVPISGDAVTVSTGHDIELTGDVTVAALTLSDDSVLDLNGHTLTVEGLLTITGSSGHAPELRSTGASGDVNVQCLDTQHADFVNVDIGVVDAAACTQTTILRPGTTTWTTTTFSQTGGNASIATSLTGLSPTFNGTSLRLVGESSIDGTLTLTGTGPLTFLPTAVGQTSLTLGGLVTSGTHAATVDWSGIDPLADGDAATLIRVPNSASLAGITSADTSNTLFTRPSSGGFNRLVATYEVPAAPVNSGAAPSVSASPEAAAGYVFPGETLTCDPGVWTGANSFTYAWKAGATTLSTASTYTPTAEHVGSDVVCHVTAVNGAGPTAGTLPAAVTVAARVQNTAAPNLSSPSVTAGTADAGNAAPGHVLTCAPGTWTGATSYAYAWRSGADPIAGENSATYTVVEADRGAEISCRVTASSAADEATEASAAFAVPALPQAAFSAPAPTIETRATTVSYTLQAGTTVVGCKLDGVALDGCTSGRELAGLRAGPRTFALTVKNAAGTTATFERTFTVNAKPEVTLAGVAKTYLPGDALNFTIEAVDADSVSCLVTSSFGLRVELPCQLGANSTQVPNFDNFATLRVTATNAAGSTEAASEWTRASAPSPSPTPWPSTTPTPPAPLPAGAELAPMIVPVKVRHRHELSRDYSGAVLAGDGVAAYDANRRAVSVRAPKAGVYEATWTLGTLSAPLPIFAFDPAKLGLPKTKLKGSDTSDAPLECKAGPDGTLYDWYVDNRRLTVPAEEPNVLPAAAVPERGIVTCASRQPDGKFAYRKVAVAGSARIVVTVDDGEVVAYATAPATVSFTQYGSTERSRKAKRRKSKKSKRTKRVVKAQLKRGRNEVKTVDGLTRLTANVKTVDGTSQTKLTVALP